MDKKVYIVTLKKREDLETFYAEMEEKGFSLSMKRPMSRNTHYWMTEDDAVVLREDDRVIDVQTTLEDRNIVLERSVNYEPYDVTGKFWKDDTVAPSTVSNTDRQWGMIHCAGNQAQRGPNQFGSINNGGTYEDVTDTVNIFNDGNNVDVVICDDPVSHDCVEWFSPTTGQNRFVQYQWFTELNTYVGTIDDDSQTLPTGTITYHDQSTNTEFHGNHVAGTACGQHYGWAREANIYGFQVLGSMPSGQSIPNLLIFDYLRAFHANKPINPATGKRNPTITNHSWGTAYTAILKDTYPESNGGMKPSDFSYIVYNGTVYDSANQNPSGWTVEGIEADFGIAPLKYSMPSYEAALNADIEDAIADGIVVIAAAGNSNYHQVTSTDPEWDNRVYFTALNGNVFWNRGGSPGSADGVVCVGALGKYHQFQRATYTQFGPDIDVYAPGTNILSSWSDPSLISDPSWTGIGLADGKYGAGNWFYPINGTSMASPQVAGVAACLATGANRFTNDDVFEYLEKTNIEGEMTFDIGPTFSNNTYTIDVTHNGSSDYTFANATDRNGNPNGNDPDIVVWVGDTLEFSLSVSGHPFWIKTAQTTGTNDGVATGTVTNNGSTSGTVTWDTTGVTPGEYYYICQFHGSMSGKIFVGQGPGPGSFADNTKSGRSPNKMLHATTLRPTVGYITKATKKPRATTGQRFPRPSYLNK
jgi:plastocyanin